MAKRGLKKGSTCRRFRTIRAKGGKLVKRCASFGGLDGAKKSRKATRKAKR